MANTCLLLSKINMILCKSSKRKLSAIVMDGYILHNVKLLDKASSNVVYMRNNFIKCLFINVFYVGSTYAFSKRSV